MPAGFQYIEEPSLAIDVNAPPIPIALDPISVDRNLAAIVPVLSTALAVEQRKIANKTDDNLFI